MPKSIKGSKSYETLHQNRTVPAGCLLLRIYGGLHFPLQSVPVSGRDCQDLRRQHRAGGLAAHLLCHSLRGGSGVFRAAGGPAAGAKAHADWAVGVGSCERAVFLLPLFPAAGGAVVRERPFAVADLDPHRAHPGGAFQGQGAGSRRILYVPDADFRVSHCLGPVRAAHQPAFLAHRVPGVRPGHGRNCCSFCSVHEAPSGGL